MADKKANIIVIAALVIVIASVCAVVNLVAGGGTDEELVAKVHDGDGRIHEMPLFRDQSQVIRTSLGTNTVVVQGGEVFVYEADCDNHDCIRQGRISKPGQQIICLPHKLWIEIAPQGNAPAPMDESAIPQQREDFDTVSR